VQKQKTVIVNYVCKLPYCKYDTYQMVRNFFKNKIPIPSLIANNLIPIPIPISIPINLCSPTVVLFPFPWDFHRILWSRENSHRVYWGGMLILAQCLHFTNYATLFVMYKLLCLFID